MISVEKNEGRRENVSGRMTGTKASVSHSKVRDVASAVVNCKPHVVEEVSSCATYKLFLGSFSTPRDGPFSSPF